MTPLVPIALFGWWVVVVGALLALPPRRAALFLALFGWMFLPIAGYKIEGLPAYDKPNIVALGLLAALLTAGSTAWRGLRWNWVDTAVLVLCFSPGASALVVGTGVYDAASAVTTRTMTWGFAYVTGRVLLRDEVGLRDLCWAMFLAGLVYVPFCLWEIRMSPQLHGTIYGYHQHDFSQTIRGGGFRPQVFMHHGLAVGIFMVFACIAGISIWRFARVRSILGIDFGWVVAALVLTTVLCKSTGATMLLIAVSPVLLMRARKVIIPYLAACVWVTVVYLATRTTGIWDAYGIMELVREVFSPDRTQSLEFRIKSENRLIAKGMQRPILGWTPWAFQEVVDDAGDARTVVTDSRWIIAYLTNGLVGLGSLAIAYVGPVLMSLRRVARVDTSAPMFPYVLFAALMIAVAWIDLMFNSFESPILIMAIGALSTFSVGRWGYRGIARFPEARVQDWSDADIRGEEANQVGPQVNRKPGTLTRVRPRG